MPTIINYVNLADIWQVFEIIMLFEDLSWEEKNALRGKISERRKYKWKSELKMFEGE